MPRLTDTQLVILSAAAQREDRTALPLPESVTTNKGAATRLLKALLKTGLITEQPRAKDQPLWRETAEEGALTLVITDRGLDAIGVEPSPEPEVTESTNPKANRKPVGATKLDNVVALLKTPDGATIAALQKATGWQPHSVRAALAGLRKRGMTVSRDRTPEGETRYRVEA